MRVRAIAFSAAAVREPSKHSKSVREGLLNVQALQLRARFGESATVHFNRLRQFAFTAH